MRASPSSTPTGEARAERRRATILFADIQDSTKLIQDLDPEAATRLLDPPIKAMVDAVTRYHGTISHILGDGIVAIFGAPAASEDHAVMACLAALAILESLDPQNAGAIRARVGMHSGEVMFRHLQFGKSQTYDSVGATVNIAARLEQTAEPGTACLSAATYKLAKGFIDASPLDAVAMKGIDGEIRRFRLLGMNQAASRWSVRSQSDLSHFTGRLDEFEWLGAALERSRLGQRLVAHVAGPPGIGKSRLLHEFLADGAGSSCVFKLVGSPHSREAAFQPFRSWLLGWAGIGPSDSTAAANAKLGQALDFFEHLTELDRSRLSSLLGLRDRPPAGTDHTGTPIPLRAEQTLAKLFAGVANGRLVVLALDDVDCFDAMSLELVEALVAALADTPFLLITTSRMRFRFSAEVMLPALSLKLKPLSNADAESLLIAQDSRFLENPELTQVVIQKTTGNPLFIEEVASLVAQAQQPGGNWSGNVGIDRLTLRIPDRIEPLIADRLSKLSAKQRRLLELCAVIGNDVPLYLLRPLAGFEEADLQHRLGVLQSRRLIYKNEGNGVESCGFRHSIIRDVCFNSMLLSVRRSCHERILAVLEQEVGPRHDLRIDDLCYHAINAEQWEKAILHLRAAADAAVEKSAFKLGELYLVRASDIAARLPENDGILRTRIEILLSLRTLIGATGKYAQANESLEQAEELARRLGDHEYQARVLAFRVHVLNILGDLEGAISAGNRSRTLALQSGDRSLLALSNFVLGQAHFNRGEFLKAEAALLGNVALLEGPPIALRLGTMATLTVSNPATLAVARAFQGRFEDAESSAHEALRAASATGRPYDATFADLSHGVTLLQRRSADAATAAFSRALELAKQRELEQMLPPVLVGLGQARILALDLDGGLKNLDAARNLSIAQNRYMIQIWAASSISLALTRLGRAQDAVQLARGAVEMAERFGFFGFRVSALRSLGLAQAASGGHGARATLTRALELSLDVGAVAETAHCHMALSTCAGGETAQHSDSARRIYAGIGLLELFDRLSAMPPGDRICLL